MNMKRFLYSIFLLSMVACSGNKPQGVDVAGITPSPFVGYWVNVGVNDTVQNISLRIGERNDSLLVSFYWEREEPFYMTENPMSDTAGEVIPQACIAVPKNGNKAAGTIVNQYFSVFQNYPRNEYYPLCLELKSFDTLTFKIDGNVNYWPDSAILVRKSSENSAFSTKVVDLYKEHYNIPDTEVTDTNKFDISGIEPSPFIGRWEWTENGPWQNFYIYVAERNDSLLIAPGGVFLGGYRIQNAEYDEEDRLFPQAFLQLPKSGNKAVGYFAADEIPFAGKCNSGVSLELFSNNTMLFVTRESIGFWPDSAVMVRTSSECPVFR